MSPEAQHFVQILWDYHYLDQPITAADAIIALGGSDLRVARHAAHLYKRELAPIIVATGGMCHHDDLLATGWDVPEAVRFKETFLQEGVPLKDMIIEDKAANTGENISFSRRLLRVRIPLISRVILSAKPHMQRRAYATCKAVWPEVNVVVSSWQTTFAEFCTGHADPDVVSNLMVGDLQRIDVYGKRGFQIAQEIPSPVWAAYNALVAMGYDRHLLKDG